MDKSMNVRAPVALALAAVFALCMPAAAFAEAEGNQAWENDGTGSIALSYTVAEEPATATVPANTGRTSGPAGKVPKTGYADEAAIACAFALGAGSLLNLAHAKAQQRKEEPW